MDQTEAELIGLLEARRRLAAAMLEAHSAGAFDRPMTDEDAAFFEAELAECDARLAELRKR